MAKASMVPASAPEPYLHLLESRDLPFLWLMRMMVHLTSLKDLWSKPSHGVREQLLGRLGLREKDIEKPAQRSEVAQRLACSLEAIEQQASEYRHSEIRQHNMAFLSEHFGLTTVEAQLLMLAVLFRADPVLEVLAEGTRPQDNPSQQLATILGIEEGEAEHALRREATLRRSGLIRLAFGGPLSFNFKNARSSLRRLAFERMVCVDDFFRGLMLQAPVPTLDEEHYAFIRAQVDMARGLLADAMEHQRKGVNILLYGSPGTGKTQLMRWLAHRLDVPLYDISPDEGDDTPQGSSPETRLGKTATCLQLLRGRRAILAMDECDVIFNDRPLSEAGSTAGQIKAWVNDLLETNPIPMIWIANQIHGMDPAFMRRFDMVMKLETPPVHQRIELLKSTCGDLIDAIHLRRFAQVESATPGVLMRAMGAMQRIQRRQQDLKPEIILETLLDGTLRAQRHKTVSMANRDTVLAHYDPALCNASVDLGTLAEGVRRAGQGRILLYGPPGTGKTAFGHWLANTLGKPLSLKRVSDIQRPWLGEMEQNLARAFEEAMRDGAVLQIDEVDGFLQDRRDAHRSWEVSQVNEFLTQLESFAGIFIASTNLMDGLDQSALRRFDHKVQVGYLKAGQAWEMFRRKLTDWGLPITDADACRQRLSTMVNLTPGDFAVLARRHWLTPYSSAMTALDALSEEVALKGGAPRRIGFT